MPALPEPQFVERDPQKITAELIAQYESLAITEGAGVLGPMSTSGRLLPVARAAIGQKRTITQ
ncbi:hypothetical protein N5J43_13560 [Pseudomonas nicosulfuronedens]|uniref:hypothetical protein n=1 Tax=Pseudomonas nicosulfuronedens TaxID=2571105 RepID=UPI00244D5849|nr:hypothetical protein [Pseudomonas nicosulfuronedens]MDH1012474.1 hypothetical protein [Pseudomonas nicosulfuronedens]MDH1979979.1 hypothetical protein [Pseudomonas nicosulfuronedens]MDH2029917.1 hypothetical protein [Pseudomonas nicosulfuronedens]